VFTRVHVLPRFSRLCQKRKSPWVNEQNKKTNQRKKKNEKDKLGRFNYEKGIFLQLQVCSNVSVLFFFMMAFLCSPFDYPLKALRKKRDVFILSHPNFREAHVAGTPDIPHFIGWQLFVLTSLSEDV